MYSPFIKKNTCRQLRRHGLEQAHGEETGRAGKGEQRKKGQLLELRNGNSKDETRTSGIFSFCQHHTIRWPTEGAHWDGGSRLREPWSMCGGGCSFPCLFPSFPAISVRCCLSCARLLKDLLQGHKWSRKPSVVPRWSAEVKAA